MHIEKGMQDYKPEKALRELPPIRTVLKFVASHLVLFEKEILVFTINKICARLYAI
jgi:hypothetical protein